MKPSSSLLRHKEGLEGVSPTSQTLIRGLDVLEMVANGPMPLPALADRLGLARSTTHRLATALLERRYLTLTPREGYVLGPKVLELGSLAREQTVLLRVARLHMEKLADESLDTVHLTVCESGTALLIERIQGHRRLLPSLRIGERTKITQCTGGHALLLDQPEAVWREAFAQDCGSDCPDTAAWRERLSLFLASMREAASLGYASDAADGADPLSTVAAPIRGAGGEVVAALGLSMAAHYVDGGGFAASGRAVRAVAAAISADLGHPSPAAVGKTVTAHRAEIKNRAADGADAGEQPAHPLEGRSARVHDRRVNGSAHASEPDLGVA
jgi:DNA-binding IclR family transcriptional regulator